MYYWKIICTLDVSLYTSRIIAVRPKERYGNNATNSDDNFWGFHSNGPEFVHSDGFKTNC